LNSYRVAPTRPSTLRVCQFRHPGTGGESLRCRRHGDKSIVEGVLLVNPPGAGARPCGPLENWLIWRGLRNHFFRGGIVAVFVCDKCGHMTKDVRCCPKVCPKCGAPKEALKKK